MLKQLLKALKKFEEFSQFCSTPGVSRQGKPPKDKRVRLSTF